MAILTDLPLRWESTGDKWWYASPIDWAAANGHYDLVHELLRIDGNQLIKLTSLRRIRRLEAVWDNDDNYHDSAMSRCQVAHKLYNQCQNDQHGCKTNSLIVNGYGGWLLYTAVSAGDISFVKEILSCYPLLVFGEGEYGLTDILYGAARSKNNDVFMVVYDYSVSPQFLRGKMQGGKGDFRVDFIEEVKYRAVFAAARGGNLIGLKGLLGECSDVLVYRDVNGSSLLHAAAGKGQIEVVKYLLSSYNIISSIDNEGNTPLHVAAYKGQLSVLEPLVLASPSSYSALNKSGNTFLHMLITGFQTPGFRRLDQQIELMKHLVKTKCYKIQDIVNCKNNQGRTALHLAIIGNIHSNLIQLLMSARFININIRDDHGMTALDYVKQQPQCESSDMLIRHLISAGGISNCKDDAVRKAFASHLKMQGICMSPGTSFSVPDNEIFISTGISHMMDPHPQRVRVSHLHTSSEASACNLSSSGENGTPYTKKSSPFHTAAKRLMTMLQWPLMRKKEMDRSKKPREETPIPLRQIFSDPNLLRNKRTLELRSNISSPINRKKFASGVAAHGDLPFFNIPVQSSSSLVYKSSISSHGSLDEGICMEDEIPYVDNMQGYTNTNSANGILYLGGSPPSIKNTIGKNSAKCPVNMVA